MVEIISGLRFLHIANVKAIWDVRDSCIRGSLEEELNNPQYYTMQGTPAKHMLRLSKLAKLLDGSYEQIQARLRGLESPCIPFIAAYLHEVAYIWDSFPSFIYPDEVTHLHSRCVYLSIYPSVHLSNDRPLDSCS